MVEIMAERITGENGDWGKLPVQGTKALWDITRSFEDMNDFDNTFCHKTSFMERYFEVGSTS